MNVTSEMNALETFLLESGRDETDAMNTLQDQAIISDNAVWARDVANMDCFRAVKFLLLESDNALRL